VHGRARASFSSQGTSVDEPSSADAPSSAEEPSPGHAPIVGEKRNSTSPRFAGKKPKNYQGDDRSTEESGSGESDEESEESEEEDAPASALAPALAPAAGSSLPGAIDVGGAD
jgi:hypothetical protein